MGVETGEMKEGCRALLPACIALQASVNAREGPLLGVVKGGGGQAARHLQGLLPCPAGCVKATLSTGIRHYSKGPHCRR